MVDNQLIRLIRLGCFIERMGRRDESQHRRGCSDADQTGGGPSQSQRLPQNSVAVVDSSCFMSPAG